MCTPRSWGFVAAHDLKELSANPRGPCICAVLCLTYTSVCLHFLDAHACLPPSASPRSSSYPFAHTHTHSSTKHACLSPRRTAGVAAARRVLMWGVDEWGRGGAREWREGDSASAWRLSWEPLGGMLRQRGKAQAQAPSEMSTLRSGCKRRKVICLSMLGIRTGGR